MRLTTTDILQAHLRNINLVGSTDTNILADFYMNLGQRYQLALAKLANYRTTTDYAFSTGMQATLLTSGVSQTISGITSSSTTATVTTSAAHGYSTSNVISITGAYPAAYNGTYTITVTGTTTFTYTLSAAQTVTTATCSQYFPLPLGEVLIEGMYVTIGNVNYPIEQISSRLKWEQLNAVLIQPTNFPRFYFPRRDDFGIWPTPQTVYSGNISYRYRDRDLSVADYSAGTVTMTYGSTQVTGVGTTFTSAMVGRWITVTDPTIQGQGYWLRIVGYTSATVLTVSQVWPYPTATTAALAYRIGETPEIPEELHSILAWGTASDYYGGMRKDAQNAALYDNLFWTGNPSNTARTQGDSSITGGLLGGMDRYASRDDRHLIKKAHNFDPLNMLMWGQSLSNS